MKRQNIYVKKKFKELKNIIFGGKCFFCNSEIELQFIHIIPTKLKGEGRGRNKRYYDIKKNPNKYCLACIDCHNLFDSGKMELLSIKLI